MKPLNANLVIEKRLHTKPIRGMTFRIYDIGLGIQLSQTVGDKLSITVNQHP